MPKNRILVADDNKLNQDLLSAILGNDYDYLYANNGIEVISALEKNEAIDIILLDINMSMPNKKERLFKTKVGQASTGI